MINRRLRAILPHARGRVCRRAAGLTVLARRWNKKRSDGRISRAATGAYADPARGRGKKRSAGRTDALVPDGGFDWKWLIMDTYKPNDSAHFRKGVAMQEKGDLDGAIRHYRMAVRDNPDDIVAHTNMAAALIDAGRMEEAEDLCQKALDMDQNCDSAYDNMGLIMRRTGKPEMAVPYYDRALAIRANLVTPKRELARLYNNKGAALADMGSLEESVICYDKAIATDPSYALPRANKGASLFKLGRRREASECVARARELDPDCYVPPYPTGDAPRE